MNRYLILLLSIFILSCNSNNNNNIVVDFSDSVNIDQDKEDISSKAIYIAIASITSPKETYKYYHDLIHHISEKIGRPILIKQKKTYEEVNLLLENSEVDFAFICSGAFVDEYKKGKIKLMVIPEINNEISYQAYIITQKDSEINKFEDFKDKSFGFTDPLSNTGLLFPLQKVNLLCKDKDDFFSKTIYTYGHDISIQMVNRGIIDGASVNGLIYNYLAYNNPEKVKNIKVIAKSEKFGMPPVVTPVSLNRKCFKKIQNVFLNLHNDSIGKEILDKLQIDRFVIPNESMYESVFALKEIIENDKE